MPDKALILAINSYESVSSLRGCVNDARDMERLFRETFAFPAENIKVILNGEVKKSRIRPVMNWLFEDARPGDRVALHFSGHGSRIADEDKDESGDHLDELICLQDMDFSKTTSFMTDDELGRWTKKCPAGVHLTVFLDCCHSGTGTRKLIPPAKTQPSLMYPRIVEHTTAARAALRLGARAARGEALSMDTLTRLAMSLGEAEPRDQVFARFVEPPEAMEARVQRALALGERPRGATYEVDKNLNHLLLAACQDTQTAADAYIKDEFRGAFTYYLVQTYREAGRELDRHELIARIAQALEQNRYQQIPRLEAAAKHGALFTKGSDEPKPSTEPPTPEPPAPSAPGGDLLPGEADAGADLLPEEHGGDGLLPGEADEGGSGGGGGGGSGSTMPQSITPLMPLDPRASEGESLFRELLATYNRLLDLIQPGGGRAQPLATRAGTRALVYVHGIGTHHAGYSNAWWASMRRFTPSLQPGLLNSSANPAGNRYEVLWSAVVNRSLGAAAGDYLDARELAQRIRDELEDRLDASVELKEEVAAATTGERSLSIDREALRGELGRGIFGGIDDFTLYMTNAAIRTAVIQAFLNTVKPLLRAGRELELITHSWGSVVAFEAMRQLDGDPSIPAARVRNFFTVGSALSIPAVRWNLSGRIPDGRKPRVVRRWINLDASGDLVGGAIRDKGFGVDIERLKLPTVVCNPILPDPVCAHSSYFAPSNEGVNRDIFGAFIEQF